MLFDELGAHNRAEAISLKALLFLISGRGLNSAGAERRTSLFTRVASHPFLVVNFAGWLETRR